MDQQTSAGVTGGSQREFLVSTVHGVPGLEGDDTTPAPQLEFGPQLRRCMPELGEVLM
jgi:hypothetical protein